MQYSINIMSHYVQQILKDGAAGSVHSVYRKTINLSINGKLAALQASGSPLSPISLICTLSASDMASLPVQQGDPVHLGTGYVEIQTAATPCRFLYADASFRDLFLSGSLSPDLHAVLASNIRTTLSNAKTGGFEMIFNNKTDYDISLMFQVAKKRIQQSTALYRKKNPTEAATELSRLLGLGIGLTPSGDDFLCGVLAGLRLRGLDNTEFSQRLKSEIQAHLADTLDVSAAFLVCALENQYSLAVNSLYTIPSPETLLSTFSEIGHSSGMDTLCGVLYALTL